MSCYWSLLEKMYGQQAIPVVILWVSMDSCCGNKRVIR